jgi:hypothetical protein
MRTPCATFAAAFRSALATFVIAFGCGGTAAQKATGTDAAGGGPGSSAGSCQLGSDCPEFFPHCVAGRCSTCASDADCPSGAPVCASDWEGNGISCSVCRVGDRTCGPGQWCTNAVQLAGTAGQCVATSCATDPSTTACRLCTDELEDECFANGAACEGPMAAAASCMEAAIAIGTGGACDLEKLEDRAACRAPCADEHAALDACIATCPSVVDGCG